MKKRNPAAVFFLSLITLGIYGIVWSVKTKNEMNRIGATIPSAWLMIIPFVSIYWTWKYCEGVEKVTGNKLSQVMSFVLLFLLSIIGMAIVQSEFNKLSAVAADGAPLAPNPNPNPMPQPDNSFGGPVQTTPTVISPTSQPPQTSQPVQPVQPTEPPQAPQPPQTV